MCASLIVALFLLMHGICALFVTPNYSCMAQERGAKGKVAER